MNQLNFHNNETSKSIHTHTHTQLPIIQRFVSAYKIWNKFKNDFPKKFRYTLVNKIDSLFVETTELLFIAGYLNKDQKLFVLQKASGKLDLLKFFPQISWEMKIIDNKKYILISRYLDEIGKMLGGWLGQTYKKENPV